MSKSVGVAVVGAGKWGRNLVRTTAGLGVLAAVVDPDVERARAVAEPFKAPVFSFRDVLGNERIEAVMIAAPASSHYELASAALRAGKDVFVEKPMALNTAEGAALIGMARSAGRVLMVGHLLQYHSAFIKLRELVRAGEFGRILNVYSHRLNIGTIRREEDALWSLAPHDVSMILTIAGEPPVEVGSFALPAFHAEISDTTIVHLAFPSGLQAHVHVSWLNPVKEQRLVVVGSNAMAVFDDTAPWERKLALYRHEIVWQDGSPTARANEPHYIAVDPSEPLKDECLHFLECVEKRTLPLTDGAEGLRVLSVLERASRKKPGDLGKDPPGIHPSAIVDEDVRVGLRTKVWHFSHLLKGTSIGDDCVVGQNCVIGPAVKVGNRCKIQNNVSLYQGVELEDGVFCGPSCVFTNVITPRAEYERKSEFLPTVVGRGATIGANATIVCGHRIGQYAMVAAGAVVTRDVMPHALVAGVPAVRIGWVSHAGRKLGDDLVCPEENRRYRVNSQGFLEESV